MIAKNMTVNQMVTGSSPVEGAVKIRVSNFKFETLFYFSLFGFL